MLLQPFLEAIKRTFHKNSLLACINIAGLSIALAASLIIVFYVQHETSYDKHWPEAERLFRINNNFTLPGRAPYRLATTSSLLIPALQQYFPAEIETAARARSMPLTYRIGAEKFTDVVVAVDPSFNELFALNTVAGSVQNALVDNNGIALREDIALNIFGSTHVLNKTVTIEYPSTALDYRVAAVYVKGDASSVLELPALIRLDETNVADGLALGGSLGTWNQAPVASYLKLKPGVNPAAISVRLNEFSDTHVDASAMALGPNAKASERLFFDLSRLSDIHLDANFQNVRGAGSRVMVQAFSVIAALIVAISCINFAYLTLAKSSSRVAEVGIRKILGASKWQLFQQYLAESFVLVGLSLVVGMMLLELLQPLLTALLAMPLPIDYGDPHTYLNIVVLYLLVALLGGLYPALVLSRFRPVVALKPALGKQGGQGVLTPKNVLLVFQFGVAVALIIATSVIYLQVELLSERDPGFKQDKLIFITNLLGRQEANANKQTLKAEVKKLPKVLAASLSSYHPLATTTWARVSSAHGLQDSAGETFTLANTFIDDNYLQTYNIAMVAGRNFSEEQDRTALPGVPGIRATDIAPRTTLVNEAAARFLGFSQVQDALGKVIVDRSEFPGINYTYTIIGVVADNQFYTLKAVTRPEIYFYHPAFTDVLTVRYQGNGDAMMHSLQQRWKQVMGDAEFSASFVEPLIAREFAQERREGQLLVVFSLFSLFIACLGLYGIAALNADRRTKEIGIRKIMGAEVGEIVALLLWQFSKPVLLANVIAWPVAMWLMLSWLQRFPYQIEAVLLIPLCVLAGVIALSIAWLTVVSTTVRVANAKPVLALRYE